MKKFKFLILGLFILLGFASCVSVQTASDYDKAVNFNQFKTYAFYKPDIDEVPLEDEMKRDVLRLIDKELSNKAYTKSSNPDLLVSFALNVEEVYDERAYYNTSLDDIYASNYEWLEGVLFISIIEASTYNLIWEGMGSMRIRENMSKSEIDSFFRKTIKSIMDEYPPN